MAVYQLENEHIYLEVASHGAELVRLLAQHPQAQLCASGWQEDKKGIFI